MTSLKCTKPSISAKVTKLTKYTKFVKTIKSTIKGLRNSLLKPFLTLSMKTVSCVLLTVCFSLGNLYALPIGAVVPTSGVAAVTSSSGTEDMPPVPFIIGGDDAVAPAAAQTSGPLVLPEEAPMAPTPAADPTFGAPSPAATAAPVSPVTPVSVAGDLDSVAPIETPKPAEVSSAAPSVNPTETLPLSLLPLLDETPIAPAPIPVAAPVVPASVAPKSAETPAVPAAVASASEPEEKGWMQLTQLQQAKEAAAIPPVPVDMSPAPAASVPVPMVPVPAVVSSADVNAPRAIVSVPEVEFKEPPLKVIAADGTLQTKGMEYRVGRSNTYLPPVQVSTAVSAIGEEFPELHVDQIPLEDLLAYLKDFTPKALRYELTSPMYVTVDLKAKSVEEVLYYLMARYPIQATTDGNSIFVRPAVARQVNETLRPMPSGAIAAPNVKLQSLMIEQEPIGMATVGARPAAVSVYSGSRAHDNVGISANWDQVRIKARLYELQKERTELLNQREKILQKIGEYNMEGRAE